MLPTPAIKPRVAIVVRYVPWWVSVEFGGRNNAIVPQHVYEAFPEDVKPLYRHRVDGVANNIFLKTAGCTFEFRNGEGAFQGWYGRGSSEKT